MRYAEFIRETMENRTGIDWNYYGSPITVRDVTSPEEALQLIHAYFESGAKDFPFVLDPMAADRWIRYYFRMGEKEQVLSWSPAFQAADAVLPGDRAVHTVSGFFLGLLMERCLTGDRPLILQSPLWLPFSYLWFLTFLYHDYGYCIVERENAPLQAPRYAPVPDITCLRHSGLARRFEYAAFQRVKRRLGIDASLFSPCRRPAFNARDRRCAAEDARYWLCELTKQSLRIFRHPGLRFSTGAEIHRQRYTGADTVRYFNYCINEWRKIDHGIIGGFLFYDRMVKNYIAAYFAAFRERSGLWGVPASIHDFVYRNRHFCTEQLPVFLYIAGCIAAHNIWKQGRDQREAYELYLLDALLSENYRSITFEEDPLLYILALADTLEPTKIYQQQEKYRGLSAAEVSNAVCVEYTPGSRRLTFSTDSDAVSVEPLYKKAKGLEGWTSAHCSAAGKNTFDLFI